MLIQTLRDIEDDEMLLGCVQSRLLLWPHVFLLLVMLLLLPLLTPKLVSKRAIGIPKFGLNLQESLKSVWVLYPICLSLFGLY